MKNSQSIALLYNDIHEDNNLKYGETNITAATITFNLVNEQQKVYFYGTLIFNSII